MQLIMSFNLGLLAS